MIDLPLYGIGVARTSDACTVTLTGELDLVSCAEVQSVLVDEIAGANGRVLTVDMAAVTFLDSTAISALIAAYRHAGQVGVRFTVTKPSRQVTQVLQLTGLLELFTDD